MTAPTTADAPRLTADEVQRFHEQGYLLPKFQVFQDPTEFKALQDTFEELLVKWQADPRAKSPEHMDTPHFLYPELFHWAFHPDVLAMVEPILGSDLALFSSHFICKPPAKGKRVPWHEDSAYWKGRLDPMRVVTVWLAIDPSTPDNGCMRLIPGTHSNGFSDYGEVDNVAGNVFDTEIKAGSYDESKAIDCVLEPGQCSLHEGRIIHGSNANTGAMRRCGWTLRFIPTDVKFINPSNDGFQVYLAKGQDKAGNTYGDPTKVNQNFIDAYPNAYPVGH